MNPQAMLKLLLGVTEGLAMYAIYSDYAIELLHLIEVGVFLLFMLNFLFVIIYTLKMYGLQSDS